MKTFVCYFNDNTSTNKTNTDYFSDKTTPVAIATYALKQNSYRDTVHVYVITCGTH